MSDDPHYQATEEAHTGPIKNPEATAAGGLFLLHRSHPDHRRPGVLRGVGHPARGRGQGRQHGAVRRLARRRATANVADRLKRVGCHRDPRRQPRRSPPAKPCSRRSAWPATARPASPARRTSATPPPGARASARATPRCSSMRSRARARCRPQGGGDFEDLEIGRAVVYMANAGGAKFPVPDRPAAAAPAADGAAAPAAPAAAAAAPAAPAAAAPRLQLRRLPHQSASQ